MSHWPPEARVCLGDPITPPRLVGRDCRLGVEALVMLCSQETSVHPPAGMGHNPDGGASTSSPGALERVLSAARCQAIENLRYLD